MHEPLFNGGLLAFKLGDFQESYAHGTPEPVGAASTQMQLLFRRLSGCIWPFDPLDKTIGFCCCCVAVIYSRGESRGVVDNDAMIAIHVILNTMEKDSIGHPPCHPIHHCFGAKLPFFQHLAPRLIPPFMFFFAIYPPFPHSNLGDTVGPATVRIAPCRGCPAPPSPPKPWTCTPTRQWSTAGAARRDWGGGGRVGWLDIGVSLWVLVLLTGLLAASSLI